MVHRSSLSPALFLALGLSVAACGGGSSVSNASPRLSTIPTQTTTGGATFTFDLGDYVVDRESSSLTYAVASGGGAFAGSTYSNTFDTMGEFTVAFTVSDGSKTTAGEFDVRVTSANFVVVKEDDSGLLLLDSATNAFVRVTGASASPTFAAGLADGRLVYQLAGGNDQLWIFDPMTREATRLAPNADEDVTYRARTSDGRIVYSIGPSTAQQLLCHNPATGLSTAVAQDALSTLTVLVNTADLVFFEVGVNGQADVYAYDADENETFAVGTSATDEQLQAVLPDGGVVFSRIGDGGEQDLFYYRVGTGLVEVGADQSALESRNKTYVGQGSGSQVVFTALNGTDEELWFWNPANGQTTAIATGADHAFDAVGAGNEVVYRTIVGPTEHDISFYDLDDATAAVVRDASDLGAVLAVVDGGSTRWAIVQGSGATSSVLAVSLVSSPSTQTWAAGGAAELGGVLANGDVVAQRTDGTALAAFDASAGSWGTPIAGAGLAFGGDGLDDGDFVYEVEAGGQTDLSMWDASATASVVVSDTAGDDAFAASTAGGTILFTRVVTGNTNTDLFVWDGADETRLTDEDAAGLFFDHTVLGQFSGTRQ